MADKASAARSTDRVTRVMGAPAGPMRADGRRRMRAEYSCNKKTPIGFFELRFGGNINASA
jgi:hypothetical protein